MKAVVQSIARITTCAALSFVACAALFAILHFILVAGPQLRAGVFPNVPIQEAIIAGILGGLLGSLFALISAPDGMPPQVGYVAYGSALAVFWGVVAASLLTIGVSKGDANDVKWFVLTRIIPILIGGGGLSGYAFGLLRRKRRRLLGEASKAGKDTGPEMGCGTDCLEK